MNQAPSDRYVNIGSIRTRYWAVGDEGPVIICVHGILRFVEDWLPNIEALGENHRVYALDLVGYGRTGKPDIAYSLEDFVTFLNGFMEALAIERATLIGHSLGGGVVLNMAHLHPEKVERLVLVAGVGFGREVHLAFRLASVPLLPELFARPNRTIMARAFEEVVFDPALITPEMIDMAYEMFYLPGAREAMLKTIRSGIALSGVHPELLAIVREAIPTITTPALVVWGRQDAVLPVKHAQVAGDNLPKARLHLLDECGHFPMFEHPEVFNALVQEFLAANIDPINEMALAEVAF